MKEPRTYRAGDIFKVHPDWESDLVGEWIIVDVRDDLVLLYPLGLGGGMVMTGLSALKPARKNYVWVRRSTEDHATTVREANHTIANMRRKYTAEIQQLRYRLSHESLRARDS